MFSPNSYLFCRWAHHRRASIWDLAGSGSLIFQVGVRNHPHHHYRQDFATRHIMTKDEYKLPTDA